MSKPNTPSPDGKQSKACASAFDKLELLKKSADEVSYHSRGGRRLKQFVHYHDDILTLFWILSDAEMNGDAEIGFSAYVARAIIRELHNNVVGYLDETDTLANRAQNFIKAIKKIPVKEGEENE